jgi:hypothetical protein
MPPVMGELRSDDMSETADGLVTRLRNPVTGSWVEMKPPVPLAAVIPRGAGTFAERFERWCAAAWDLGHCDPQSAEAGALGWDTGPSTFPAFGATALQAMDETARLCAAQQAREMAHGTPMPSPDEAARAEFERERAGTVETEINGWPVRVPSGGAAGTPLTGAFHQHVPGGPFRAGTACAPSREGGMCGCGEDSGKDSGPCLQRECDC